MTADTHSLIDREVYSTPLSKLKLAIDNPRRGNVQKIAESLEELEQYRPIVVNKRVGTTYGDNSILAGNHTYRAAKHLGWKRIDVVFVDVDDVKAKKIIAADNRTAELGGYDPTVLAKFLEDMPDLKGTGWSEPDLTDLLAQTQEVAAVGVTSGMIEGTETMTGGAHEAHRILGTDVNEDDDDFGEDPLAPADDVEGMDVEEFEVEGGEEEDQSSGKLEDEFDGEMESAIVELRDDVLFASKAEWHIPELKPGMLMDTLPEPLDTWCGQEVTPDEEGMHWLYNYGADSPKGMPWDRTLLCFYTHDRFFDSWWEYPAYYTSRVLQAQIIGAVTPNFTVFMNGPDAVNLYNTYRARWMGRYFQEAGIKVIPDINIPSMNALEWTLYGIPKNPPIISIQLQSIGGATEEERIEVVKAALADLNPGHVLAYGGNPAKRIMEAANPTMDWTHLENRAAKRRGAVFDEWKKNPEKVKVERALVDQEGEEDDWEEPEE